MQRNFLGYVGSLAHLKNKHFSPEHGDCVKIALADVGAVVIWTIGGARPVRPARGRSGRVLRRMGCPGVWRGWSPGGHSGESLSRRTARGSYKKQTNSIYLQNLYK